MRIFKQSELNLQASKPVVRFGDLNIGDTFRINTSWYMKIRPVRSGHDGIISGNCVIFDLQCLGCLGNTQAVKDVNKLTVFIKDE